MIQYTRLGVKFGGEKLNYTLSVFSLLFLSDFPLIREHTNLI